MERALDLSGNLKVQAFRDWIQLILSAPDRIIIRHTGFWSCYEQPHRRKTLRRHRESMLTAHGPSRIRSEVRRHCKLLSLCAPSSLKVTAVVLFFRRANYRYQTMQAKFMIIGKLEKNSVQTKPTCSVIAYCFHSAVQLVSTQIQNCRLVSVNN